MDRLKLLTEKIGGWWIGVKFHYNGAFEPDPQMEPIHFCAAVAKSRTAPVTLAPQNVDCPGARRSLGWAAEGDAGLAAAMAEKTGMAPEVAEGLVFDTPCLKTTPTAITVGECDAPEVALSFIQAEAAMKVLRHWEKRSGKPLRVELPTVMAACGNVAVKAYLTNRVCLSFGCPDSRKHGSIGRDRLVMGLPTSLVEELM